MTNEEILAHPNPQPLRTDDIKIPTCQHRVSVEVACADCDEIDRLAREAK